MKASPADMAFSKCVRERADHNAKDADRSMTIIDWAFIVRISSQEAIGRLDFAEITLKRLCYSCHAWYGGNPADSGLWVTRASRRRAY